MSEERPRIVCHLSPIPKSPAIGAVRRGRIARHLAANHGWPAFNIWMADNSHKHRRVSKTSLRFCDAIGHQAGEMICWRRQLSQNRCRTGRNPPV